jgi:hypothetical protein
VVAEKKIWGEGVEPDNIACLSLNRKIGNHIFKTDYSDDPEILRSLRKYFTDKRVSSNDPGCEYVLTFTIIAADTRAVRHLGQISRLLMSFAISRMDPITGSLNKTALYKNIYGFRTDLLPIEAFELGLRAFLLPQKTRWEMMVIDTSRL